MSVIRILHRIAIADDMANVRFALRVLLETLPDIAIVAETEDVATLLTLPSLDFDLLLLDWGLTGDNPTHTIGQIRARFPTAKILIVSVHLDSQQRSLDSGADAFFHKGDAGNRLQAEIKRLLEKK